MPTEPQTASTPTSEAGLAARLAGRGGLENLPPRRRLPLLLLLAAGDRRGLLDELRSARERIAAGAPDLPPPPTLPGNGEHRLAILAGDATDLAAKIATAETRLADAGTRRLTLKSAIYYASGPPAPQGKTAFLFPGQGSQHPRMLDELCVLFPEVRSWFEDLDGTFAGLPLPAPSLLAFPPAGGLTAEERALLGRELYDLRGGAQLGVVVNLALHELVTDLGVRCDMMVGHSNGEHAALWASRTFHSDRGQLFAALRLMAEQAIAMPMPPEPEGVLTVGLRDRALLDQVLAEEADGLYLSMVNCPSQFVLAGRAGAVGRAAGRLGKAGGIVVRVPLYRAYHTPLFAGWGQWLLGLYERHEVRPGEVPLYSCASAAPYPGWPERIRGLAAEQWSNPLDFQKTVHRLYEDGARIFVEIGPDNKLKGFVGDILRGREHLAVSTSSARHSPLEQLDRMVGELFVHGLKLDFTSRTWRTLRGGPAEDSVPAADPRLDLVQAHFSLMQEFLASQARVLSMVSAVPEAPAVSEAATTAVTAWPLLGDDARCDGRRLETERRFDLERDPLLRDHSLGPAVSGMRPGPPPLAVLPFTFSMEIAAEAASRLFGGMPVVGMSGLRGSRWLALDRGALTVRITAEASEASPGVARVRLFQVENGRDFLAFEGDVEVAAAPPPPPAPLAGVAGPPPRLWSAESFYGDYAFHGPAFRGLRQVLGVAGETVEAALEVPARPVPRGAAAPPAFLLDPALLDCAGQLVGFWLLEGERRDFGIFPFHLKELRVFQPPPASGEAVVGRAAVRWHAHGATDADVDFLDARGRPIYRLRGFEQRYLAFPPRFARALLGSRARPRYISEPINPTDAGADAGARAIDGLPRGFLEESWGIWSRALAHQTLTREELDDWYEAGRPVPWLLGRVAAKETARAWAAAVHGLDLAASDLAVQGGEQGLLEVRCPELAARGPLPGLRVRFEGAGGDRVVAHVLNSAPSKDDSEVRIS